MKKPFGLSPLLKEIGFRRPELPVSKPVPNTKLLELTADYEWAADVRIPAGFRSDGASVPRIGWGITYRPNHPKVARAAWVHDWLYSTHKLDRATADAVFRDICILDGSRVRARIMYRALRLFGRFAWNKGDKK